MPAGAAPAVIVFAAAATGLVIVTLQIAYLPTLYSAFNRRETEVALLNARAGVPSWGPELLARTHYALGSGVSTIDTLPDLYAQWERWAADVAESHTTYLPLVRFRSPRPLSSWVTALLAVLDSAALFLALSPKAAPVVPARLCLRGGFLCFNRIARAMGIEMPDEPDPSGGISLSYQEFLDAIARMREVDFPIERDPADAWPDFVGWRVNYEQAAYAVAAAVDAVPALWSGPRRRRAPAIAPIRPGRGRPPSSRPGLARALVRPGRRREAAVPQVPGDCAEEPEGTAMLVTRTAWLWGRCRPASARCGGRAWWRTTRRCGPRPQLRVLVGDLQHDRVDGGPAKLFCALSGRHPDRSGAVPRQPLRWPAASSNSLAHLSCGRSPRARRPSRVRGPKHKPRSPAIPQWPRLLVPAHPGSSARSARTTLGYGHVCPWSVGQRPAGYGDECPGSACGYQGEDDAAA